MRKYKFDKNKIDSKIKDQFLNQDIKQYFEDEKDEFILEFTEIENSIKYEFEVTYSPDYKKVYDKSDIMVYSNGNEVKLTLTNKNYNPYARFLYNALQDMIEKAEIETRESDQDAKDIEETNDNLRISQ